MEEPASSAKPEPSPFEKMRELAMRVMSVPKAEVDRRETEWREQRSTVQRELKTRN